MATGSGSGGGSKRKRSYPGGYSSAMPLLSGVTPSMEDKDNDFVCPICFNFIREAHITRCGHTFCFECIIKCFDTSSRCPKCNFDLENRQSDIFPNFLLNELVAKHKIKLDKVAKASAASNPRWDIIPDYWKKNILIEAQFQFFQKKILNFIQMEQNFKKMRDQKKGKKLSLIWPKMLIFKIRLDVIQ